MLHPRPVYTSWPSPFFALMNSDHFSRAHAAIAHIMSRFRTNHVTNERWQICAQWPWTSSTQSHQQHTIFDPSASYQALHSGATTQYLTVHSIRRLPCKYGALVNTAVVGSQITFIAVRCAALQVFDRNAKSYCKISKLLQLLSIELYTRVCICFIDAFGCGYVRTKTTKEH